MLGLLQDSPLTLRALFPRLEKVFPDRQIVTARRSGILERRSFAELARRARAVGAALSGAGVAEGARVATLAGNSVEHLEVMLGAMASGRVFHALNHRLSAGELRYIVDQGQDAIAFVESAHLATWQSLGDPPSVRTTVVLDRPDGGATATPSATATDYDAFLGAACMEPWPELDERAAASICHTSGTTGSPKGVVYSHRGLTLIAMAWLAADAMAVSQRDVFLPAVPLFHAHAWGLPLAAIMAGAPMVLAGADVSPRAIASLIQTQGVTLSAGVPTIWSDLWDSIESGATAPAALRTLDRIASGGSAVPPQLLRAYESLGVELIQVWGMTEMSPLGAVSRPRREVPAGDEIAFRARHGVPSPLVDLRIVDDDGRELAWDGQAPGELEASGPWIADAYYDPSAADGRLAGEGFTTDEAGRRWLRTGDIATIGPHAYVHLVDRKKDLIKSGGEWISSSHLEQILTTHPAVGECAVIATGSQRWGERPLAVVRLRESRKASADELRQHVAQHVPRWQVPDTVVFVDALPRTAVGKVDKARLRGKFGSETY
jgi:fatty-acyl-CoA synthase